MSEHSVTVNKHTQLPWLADLTVRDVIKQMNYTFPHIIVTINGTLVHHDTYDVTFVPLNADIRIVHLIAGG